MCSSQGESSEGISGAQPSVAKDGIVSTRAALGLQRSTPLESDFDHLMISETHDDRGPDASLLLAVTSALLRR